MQSQPQQPRQHSAKSIRILLLLVALLVLLGILLRPTSTSHVPDVVRAKQAATPKQETQRQSNPLEGKPRSTAELPSPVVNDETPPPTRPRRTSTDPSLPPCDPTRFLYIGNTFGRHFNQLTSLMTGIIVARKLRRTLVVTPFSDGSASENRKGKGQRIEVDALYDIGDLLNHECIILERDWVHNAKSEIQYPFSEDDHRLHRETHHIVAACIQMRGIVMHPQQPIGSKFHCNSTHFVKFKKKEQLFYEVATSPGAAEAATLTVPLVIYLAEAMGIQSSIRPWKWLRARQPVMDLAAQVVSALRDLAAGSSVGSHLSSRVVGIHYRSLEGSCAARAKVSRTSLIETFRCPKKCQQAAQGPRHPAARHAGQGFRPTRHLY